LEGQPPEVILRAAAERWPGRLGFGTGFGAEGCVLIDAAARHHIEVDIFTLDTGVLFPETYDLWRRLEAKYGIRIRSVRPARTIQQQEQDEGPELWDRDPDRCCQLRKVEPQKAEVARFDAWVSAIRRDQTSDRAHAEIFEPDKRFGLVKVNPLVAWTTKDIWNYIVKHDVPYNPLHDQGYPSIGCQPCTSPVGAGEDPRAGRWRGKAKTECGLHVAPPPAGLTRLTANGLES
jgi:phosphoadenylyl-sulfate reductase (thioredoxin)